MDWAVFEEVLQIYQNFQRNIQTIKRRGWERRKGMTKRSRDAKRDEEAGVYENCENCEKRENDMKTYIDWKPHRVISSCL